MGWGGEATGQPHTIAARDVREGRTDVEGREVGMEGRDGRHESTWREGGSTGMEGGSTGREGVWMEGGIERGRREGDSGEASTLKYCVGSLETGAANP